ncbi:hypothetical protein [Siminovitchia fordii]|uniref:Uncharacterized protein n=1 Tax=Siminovitchia fordii TaxID=254759 RepID=A0ABQ4KBX9_9BACI|nr:hypothetical protein [Siminovitchia fordii]GIN22536.1 hypothetical protein J1TS3_36700 [Siminovitchia fordii]
MNPFPGVFRYESSRDNETREPTEREARRKGDLISIIHLSIGQRMIIEYKDGSGVLRTSGVENLEQYDDMLIVTTENTRYVFERVQ